MTNRLFIAVIGTILLATMPALAGTGQLTGLVLNETSGEPLIGASVQIEGTTIGASCDIDGRYVIRNVPEGMHILLVSSLGFTAKRITEVVVKAGGPVTVDATLTEAVTELKAIEVSAERAKATESSMLIKRRAAVNMTDGVSAEMIRKSGDSHAGDALRRVVGVSVVDGRNLVVRGMGGRYSSVSLNGSPLPSPEPEKREVPLDLFPAGLLDGVVASKTYTPDQPAAFGGGAVDLATRDFPTSRELTFSATGSHNTETTGEPLLVYGDREERLFGVFDLGVDDGSRALPVELENPAWSADTASIEAAGEALAANRQWTPTRSTAPLNGGYNLRIGDRWGLGERASVGASASLSYNKSYKARQELYREYRAGVKSLDLSVERGTSTVLWGGLFNTALAFSDNHKVSFRGIHNRTADDEAHIALGYDDYASANIEDVRLRYSTRRITSGQVSGQHNLPWLFGSMFSWRGVFSGADRDDPMMRSNLYSWEVLDGDTVRTWQGRVGYSGSVIDINFKDRDNSIAADWSMPLVLGSKLKFGGLFQNKTRDFEVRRYLFATTGGMTPSQDYAEGVFTPENIGSDKRRNYHLESASMAGDRYDVNEHTGAFYLMTDVPLSARLRIMAGGRYEDSQMDLHTGNPAAPGPLNIRLHTGDWFPVASASFALSDQLNIRTGWSRTVARPEYRELSPFQYQDYVLGRPTQGNPNLKATYVSGYDARLEMYPNPGEVLALGVFRKIFDEPIEYTTIDATRPILTWENVDEASNWGIELEARKSLGFLAGPFSRVTLGGNLTVIESKVIFRSDDSAAPYFEVDRPLTGQSPYTFNLVLGYVSKSGGTDANLMLNAFGKRLKSLDRQIMEPFYEQPRRELDFSLSHKIWQGVAGKFSVKNLLGADYNVTQLQNEGPDQGKEVTTNRYELGRSFSLGFTYSL